MRIRDLLVHRLRAGFVPLVAALIVLAAVVYVPKEDSGPLILIGVTLFVAATLFINNRVRCPRCRENLVGVVGPFPFSFMNRASANFCPKCGISLDERISP